MVFLSSGTNQFSAGSAWSDESLRFVRRFRQTIGQTWVEAVERTTCSILAACRGQIAGYHSKKVAALALRALRRPRLPTSQLPHAPARAPLPLSGGFSLIEIMMAVGLMTVIMLGLLAMFYQTQRAMRV